MAGLTLFISKTLSTEREHLRRHKRRGGERTRLSRWASLLSVLCWFASAPLIASDDPRVQAFAEFKLALDSNDLLRAEDAAQSLVTLTEQTFGPQSRELVNPLTNWGTAAFRAGRFNEAEERYQRAIALLEGQRAGADRLLIRPLQGLGETWLESERPAEAAGVLRRAVDLSRNLDGLYNIDQLDLVDALIEAYVQTGQTADAEREHQFAFRAAETAFGKTDLRLIEPLNRYARWFESVGRYSTARGLHARALQLAEQLSSDQPLVGVPALQGLARTWFLEAVYGPEVEQQTTAPQVADGPGLMLQQPGSRFNSDGERALRYALAIVKEKAPDNHRQQGELLTLLADWYLVSGNRKARETYLEAWQALDKAADGSLDTLKTPRQLVYRAPPMAISRMQPDNPDDYTIQRVKLRATIDENGKVNDAEVAEESAAVPEATGRSAIFALRRARYAPKLEDGVPVLTTDFFFTETLWLRVSTPDPSDATP